ncbi:MAG: hypothetical protein HYW24_00565 [Candidatus Aenigmarchaeota archaeon]|nr:hypothetical protein [Candidatus Aenigmarchaeota archaeon]
MYEIEKLLVMLVTEGSVSKGVRTWKISFRNKSQNLIDLFVETFEKIFGTKPKIMEEKDGTIIAYKYSTEIAKELFKHLIHFRTKSCAEKPICPEYKKNKEEHLKECIICEGKPFHKVQLPNSIFKLPIEERMFLVKILVSAEGHLVFTQIFGRRPNELVRHIIVTCYHPALKVQFKNLIESCGFKCKFQDNVKIRISGKESLVMFKEMVGFFPDLIVSGKGKWGGTPKQELLDKMIESFVN